MLYMVTFTINIPQMLAYMAYMDPMGMDTQYGSVSKPCTPVVHIKIAGKWMFIPLKMVLIGIDPYPIWIPTRVGRKMCSTLDILCDMM